MLDGRDLGTLSTRERRKVWGREVGIIFQDPMTSLNPVVKIGKQITESLRYHMGMSRGQANRRAEELLGSVGIPEPRRRLGSYPHELSGGMRQRVTIAIALACEPKLLVADEPTTALDVTVQAQILDLLQEQQRERDMALILVTHDLGVVARRADEVAVMYAGTDRRAGRPRATSSPACACRTPRRSSARCRSSPTRATRRCSSSRDGRRTWRASRPAARSHRAAPTRRTAARRSARR